MPRYTNTQIADALRCSRGMVWVAARLLGCSPDTVRGRVRRSADLQALADLERGYALDLAETRLYEAVERGDPWAIQFYLRTQGRDRGYGERQEHTVTGALVTITIPDNGRGDRTPG